MVVLGDLNAGVGNEVIEGIVGQHGVPGRKRLLEIFAEQELVGVTVGSRKGCV